MLDLIILSLHILICFLIFLVIWHEPKVWCGSLWCGNPCMCSLSGLFLSKTFIFSQTFVGSECDCSGNVVGIGTQEENLQGRQIL